MKRIIITLCHASNLVSRLFGLQYSICKDVQAHDYLQHQASQVELMDFEAVKPAMFIH